MICFAGDGSLQMNIQELATIVERKLDIKIVVLDNHALSIVAQFQRQNWKSHPSTGDKIQSGFRAPSRRPMASPASRSPPANGMRAKIGAALKKQGPGADSLPSGSRRKTCCPCFWAATRWTTCPMNGRSDGEEKLALVTGAGSGIGKAAAIALLEAGYLVACGYNANRAGRRERSSHPNARAVKIDIASRASVKRAIAASSKHFGRDIDIRGQQRRAGAGKAVRDHHRCRLGPDAGGQSARRFHRGAGNLPAMQAKKWGRIINITSIGGQWGGMRQVHYAAAKAGLINLTHSLAGSIPATASPPMPSRRAWSPPT